MGAVSFPAGQDAFDSVVIQGFPQLEPAGEAVAGAHVVSGEKTPTPQTTEQDVFRGPETYAAKLLQS